MCNHAAAVALRRRQSSGRQPGAALPAARRPAAALIATDMALPRGAPPADTLADGDLGSILGIEHAAANGVPAQKARKPRSPRAAKPEKTLRRYA